MIIITSTKKVEIHSANQETAENILVHELQFYTVTKASEMSFSMW